MEQFLFYILAAILVASAFAMITRRSPIISASLLSICMVSMAGLFAMLSAPLLSVVQLMISAGGIVVLFIFVMMMVDHRSEERRRRVMQFSRILGSAAAVYLVIVLALSILKPPFLSAPLTGDAFEAPETFGRLLISEYMVPFQLAGILFLIAVASLIQIFKGKKGGEL